MGRLTLLLGGQKAGKSRLAARHAEASGRPVVVVTPAVVRDEEFAARVKRHRADRPSHWRTVETFELDLSGTGLDARHVEQFAQRDARPLRVTHGAVAGIKPGTRGWNRLRLFPEHWFTATAETALKFFIRSSRRSWRGRSTLPWISSRHVARSISFGMRSRWYRT